MSDIDTDTNEPEVDVSGPPADETPDEGASDDATPDDTAADDAVAETDAADDAVAEAAVAEPAVEADAADDAVAETDAADDAVAETDAADDAVAETDAADDAVAEADAADDAVAETDAADDAVAETDAADDAVAEPADEADAGEVAEPGPEAVANGQAPADADVETAEAAAAETAVATDAAAETAEAAEPEEAGTDVIAAEELLDRPPAESPYDRPGRWFVVHTQSGYEKKVKQNLEARIVSMNAEDAIYEVVIPMEDYVDFRNGKRVVAQRKMFPGYLLVRSQLDDQAWFVIRNTPGVTGFVGQGAKPSPLPRRDVESFLMPKGGTEEQVAQRAKPRLEYEIGETVRVKEGPFADFSGEVIELNEDQLKLKVLVNIFGRETPVELEFSKVAKL
jgi:transcriptional antiterminator NusG